ncbi:MAG TPA: exodeoxyribonuclease VII small subunit [Moorella mulderi]|nr:exodeoxyribonuclease VII small subunit [Moorella mulderi]
MKFEEALQKLEEIVKALEGEALSLEEALELYQEGIELLKICRQKLKEVEGKVQALFLEEDRLIIREVGSTGGEEDGSG